MQEALKLSGAKTKREIISLVLKKFVGNRRRRNLLDLAGKIQFRENYDYKTLREGKWSLSICLFSLTCSKAERMRSSAGSVVISLGALCFFVKVRIYDRKWRLVQKLLIGLPFLLSLYSKLICKGKYLLIKYTFFIYSKHILYNKIEKTMWFSQHNLAKLTSFDRFTYC